MQREAWLTSAHGCIESTQVETVAKKVPCFILSGQDAMFDPIGVACGMWEKVCMGQGILVMMERSNVAAVWVRQCKQRKGAYLNSILRRHEGNICEHCGEEARNGNLANSASEGKRHDMCGGDT